MTVIALRRAASVPTAHVPDQDMRGRINTALSYAEDPAAFLPDDTDDLADFLPALIEEEEEQLAPVGAAEVLRCLSAFAERRSVPMPEDDLGLDLDVEIMGQWPRDLFRRAIREVWTSWPSNYRRLPDVNALLECIREELQARKMRVGNLRHLALRLDRERRERMSRRAEEMRAYSRRSDPNSLENLARHIQSQ
jgi:hypothetical protein